MNLDTLAKLGEFIGGIVVLASVVYLAIQAQQYAQQQKSENYGRIIDRVSELLSRWSRDPDLNALVLAGSTDPWRLSTNDQVRFGWEMNLVFSMYEFIFHQYESGVLPDEVWERYSAHVDFWISHPGVRQWWAGNVGVFSNSFTTLVQSRADKGGMSVEESDRLWKSVLGPPPNKAMEADT